MIENNRKNLMAYKLKYYLLVLAIFICGCGFSDPVPTLAVKISGKHNTFMVYQGRASIFKKEKLKAIQICEPKDKEHTADDLKIYWLIVAENPVDTDTFEVTAGIVPDGFTQKIPSEGEIFVPVPGKKYIIAVQTDNPDTPNWSGISWIANDSNQ